MDQYNKYGIIAMLPLLYFLSAVILITMLLAMLLAVCVNLTPNMSLPLSFPLVGSSSHHSQSTLRPPLPPPHSRHQSSANSLNRGTHASRRNPSHAHQHQHQPAAPGDGPSTPESVQLHDSWALNSNVPLETRWV